MNSPDRISTLEGWLQAQPQDCFLRHALALEYLKKGFREKARSLWEAVLSDFPDYTGSYYHLGKLLEEDGNLPLAAEWYQNGMAACLKMGETHQRQELEQALQNLTTELE